MRLRGLLKGRLATVKVYSEGSLLVIKGSISTLDLGKQALVVKDESGIIRTFDLSTIIDIAPAGALVKNKSTIIHPPS